MKPMRKIAALLSAAALFAATAVPAAAENRADQTPQTPPAAAEQGEYLENQVIVVFEDNVSDSRIESEIQKEEGECLEIAPAAESSKVAVAEIQAQDTVEDAIARMEENPKVSYAQPNYQYKTAGTTNDPYNNNEGLNQWYLDNIRARAAWDTLGNTENLTPVTVAVIDTGADINHEELKSNIDLANAVKINGHKITPLTGDSDSYGHGTHVSGLIAAAANNGKGIAGIASGGAGSAVKLLPVDASDGMYLNTFDVVTAIEYARAQKVKVINMSFGGSGSDQIMEEAIAGAYGDGITLVAAAGNEDTDEMVNPSDYNEVISVCNTTREDQRYNSGCDGSNYGLDKDISAPGVNILSTVPGGYARMTGTSMSTPMVSAAAALLYTINPDLTPFQVKNILCGTARDVGSEGFDKYTGYGVLNLDEAVKAARTADEDVKLAGLTFKEDENYKKCIYEGESQMMEVLAAPANSLEPVVWESSDPNTVTVDQNGRITGCSTGKAVITCSPANAESQADREARSAVRTVYVNADNPPTSITVKNAEKAQNLAVGDMLKLNVQVLPEYADRQQVYWKSSKKSVATVDESGYVQAKGIGEAIVIGYTYNSTQRDPENLSEEGYALTAVVPVKVSQPVTKVSIINPQTKIRLGSSCTFKATAGPEDAIGREIFWSSSNRSVADIDDKGKLTTVGAGRTTIDAWTENRKSASVRITVYRTDYTASSYGLKAVSKSYKTNKLTWKAIPNADGYEIWRASKGTASKRIKTLSGSTLSWSDTGLTTGKKYTYRIRAYYKTAGGNDYCCYSTAKSSAPSLKAASVKARKGSGKITVKWSKVSGASGYAVYKYDSAKKKYVKKKTLTGRTYRDQSVKKGKKYSYKVRAYRKANGKRVYGPYSKKAVCVYK